jgi:uncharacterized membrane protein YGL010W
MSSYFNIKKSFPFYAAYHREWRNILIHVVGVPTIFTTAIYFFSLLKIETGLTNATVDAGSLIGTLSLATISVADVLWAIYTVSFFFMEPVAALLYFPVMFGMHQIGTKYFVGRASLAIALHALAWISQFVGHGVFEGRKPALLDSFFQSVHAAVFFVWLEVLFFFGYRPELLKELEKDMQKFLPENEIKKTQ